MKMDVTDFVAMSKDEVIDFVDAVYESDNWVDIQGTTDLLWFACSKIKEVRETCPEYFYEGEYDEDALALFFSKRFMKYAEENVWCD